MSDVSNEIVARIPPSAGTVLAIGGEGAAIKAFCRRRNPETRVIEAPDPGRATDCIVVSGSRGEAEIAAGLEMLSDGGQIIIDAAPYDRRRLASLLVDFGCHVFAVGPILRAVRSPDPPRRLLLHGANTQFNLHRVRGPLDFLRTVPGLRVVNDPSGFDPGHATPEEHRIFLMHRSFPRRARDLSFLRRAVAAGYLLVLDMDDAVEAFPDFRDDDGFASRVLHAVQAASEPIAAGFRETIDDVVVFANQLPDLPDRPAIRETAPVRVFFGAFNRSGDWPPLIDVINAVLREAGPAVEMHVLHDEEFYAALDRPWKQFTPRCPYAAYRGYLASSDIALMPLADTAFNRAKSDLKFLECAADGTTVLVPEVVYGASVSDGETGLVYGDTQGFAAGFRRLIRDAALRRRLALNAFEHVRRHRLLAHHYLERHRWYLDLVDRADEIRAAHRRRNPELYA